MEDDNYLLQELNKLNPTPGKPQDDEFWRIGVKSTTKIKLYSWMTVDNLERYITVNHFTANIKKYCKVMITKQIYYDVIVLGLLDISNRPKCKICGKSTPFTGFGKCYLQTCSSRCYEQLNQQRMSNLGKVCSSKLNTKESREKQRLSHKGWIPSIEYRLNVSNRMKKFYKTPEGEMHKKKLSVLTQQKNIVSRNDLSYYNKRNKGKYLSGVYKSNVLKKELSYDSSWELNFIKYIESSWLLDDIEIFDRCKDSIDYNDENKNIHKYIPDFFIKFKSGKKLVIEIKPEGLIGNPVVQAKKQSAMNYYRRKGISYIILTENELYSTRHKKYTRICDSIGIKNSFNLYDYFL